MNEITLSNELPVIEFEITQYQKQAGESIFEIGRRLKHVKENDLIHGQWEDWLSSMNMDRKQAHKFIKVTDEFSNVTTSGQISMSVLYEMTSLPEPERTKEHITSSGEVKTPDEMTVRELRELKRQLKQKEDVEKQLQSQLNQAKKSEQIAISRLESLEENKPDVIEKEVVKEVVREVVPKELQKQLEDYKNKLHRESQSANELRNELAKFKESFSDPERASDEMELKRLERDSSINAYKISISIQNFIKENSVETFRLESVIKANPESKKRLEENIELLEEFTTNIKALMNGRVIIN
ncbi:DUF3102 domain-containing protein [Macrococcoides goetzii]|nr:DUF3102 domain-containing protein [Macrococcus goetzii]TDM49957.1 DUF3102 domain-containing protein [Macrococcus goetzii]